MKAKSLLENLKERFPPCEVKGYGLVIKVPGLMWEPDWEAELPEENECVQDYTEGGKAYVLIKLPQQEPVNSRRRFVEWNDPAEEKLLINLWNKKEKVKAIHKELLKINPKRTEGEIYIKLACLQRKGVIERRKPRKHLDNTAGTPKAKPSEPELPSKSSVGSRSEPYRPLVCPCLETCEVEVTLITVGNLCYDMWEDCKHTQHLLVKKKPREWKI